MDAVRECVNKCSDKTFRFGNRRKWVKCTSVVITLAYRLIMRIDQLLIHLVFTSSERSRQMEWIAAWNLFGFAAECGTEHKFHSFYLWITFELHLGMSSKQERATLWLWNVVDLFIQNNHRLQLYFSRPHHGFWWSIYRYLIIILK